MENCLQHDNEAIIAEYCEVFTICYVIIKGLINNKLISMSTDIKQDMSGFISW